MKDYSKLINSVTLFIERVRVGQIVFCVLIKESSQPNFKKYGYKFFQEISQFLNFDVQRCLICLVKRRTFMFSCSHRFVYLYHPIQRAQYNIDFMKRGYLKVLRSKHKKTIAELNT